MHWNEDQISYREKVDYEILKSLWFGGKTSRNRKTKCSWKGFYEKKKNMIRLNMKISFPLMSRAFDNSSKRRNAFQFHSHIKYTHTLGLLWLSSCWKYLDDFQWLNQSKWRISSNVQTKGHCNGRQTRHLQTQAIIMGLKLKAKLLTTSLWHLTNTGLSEQLYRVTLENQKQQQY